MSDGAPGMGGMGWRGGASTITVGVCVVCMCVCVCVCLLGPVGEGTRHTLN